MGTLDPGGGKGGGGGACLPRRHLSEPTTTAGGDRGRSRVGARLRCERHRRGRRLKSISISGTRDVGSV